MAKRFVAKAVVKRRRATAKSVRRPVATTRTTAKSKAIAGAGISREAKQLAAAIARELSTNRIDTLSPEALQNLMAALCNAYAAQIEAGGRFTPLPARNAVSPTAVMVTASGLLRAANLAVFELGMWQSWTGR